MLTMDNRMSDAYKYEDTKAQMERYTSVKQINRIFKIGMPFKFSTIYKLAPKEFKGNIEDFLGFLNGQDNFMNLGDEGTMPLWGKDEMPFDVHNKPPFIKPFLIKNKKAPAVLIVPGGSYISVAMDHEGVQVAHRLNDMGYHAVLLSYRCSPSRFPAMHLDMMRAIKIMRKNAEKWGIIENEIIAMGFSAGGHLVLSEPGVYNTINLNDEYKDIDGRPNAIVSGYGMVDLKCGMLGITADMILLGAGLKEKKSEMLNVNNLADKNYPPVFMFAMENDPVVPPSFNCIELDKTLDRLEVPHELHIYPGDVHGFGLGKDTPAEEWPVQMDAFLRKTLIK